jgi:hypothetical protein
MDRKSFAELTSGRPKYSEVQSRFLGTCGVRHVSVTYLALDGGRPYLSIVLASTEQQPDGYEQYTGAEELPRTGSTDVSLHEKLGMSIETESGSIIGCVLGGQTVEPWPEDQLPELQEDQTS